MCARSGNGKRQFWMVFEYSDACELRGVESLLLIWLSDRLRLSRIPMTVSQFVDQLSSISLPNVFNPYRDICHVADGEESAEIRRRNLICYCEAMQSRDAR